MHPESRLFAPSAKLLRFLRAQSEEVLFLNPLHGQLVLPARTSRHCSVPKIASKPPARSLCASQHRHDATLQAAFWDLNSLVPASLRKTRQSGVERKAESPTVNFFAHHRYLSTAEKPPANVAQSWRERLWKGVRPDDSKGLDPDDCSPGSDLDSPDSLFASRTLRAKAAAEPRIRCTEVDENGEVILVDGEFKKSELIAKYGLMTRDLRKIDSSILPHILVRPSAILLNLLHLRVLIKHDRVLLFDVYGSKTSYPQSAFIYELQGRLRQKQPPAGSGQQILPYEFRALEAVLMSVTSELEADFDYVQEPVLRVLSELEDDIDRDKLRTLLVLSKRMSTFEQKAKLVRDAIEELLEADDDLAAMYLTEKTRDLYRGEDDHTEVEMLLESYHKICDEVVQGAGNLVSSIRNTEEIVRAILDANRNALMLLDLKFSVGTLGLAMGTFLAGLYGMNLKNYFETSALGFPTMAGIASLFSIMICLYGLKKLRKVQRVRMDGTEVMAHHDRMPRWLRDEVAQRLVDARYEREKARRLRMKAMAAPKKWF